MYLCNPGVFHVNIRIASCFPILYIFRKEYFFHFTKDMKLKHFVISQPFSPEFLIFKKDHMIGLSASKSENWAKFFWDVKLIFPGETSQLIFVLGLVYTQEELRLSRIKPIREGACFQNMNRMTNLEALITVL